MSEEKVLEVLGPGCPRCKETYRVVQDVVESEGLPFRVVKNESIYRVGGPAAARPTHRSLVPPEPPSRALAKPDARSSFARPQTPAAPNLPAGGRLQSDLCSGGPPTTHPRPRMVELGVMTSPAVVLGSKVLVAGRIPKAEEMRQILQQALGE